MSRTTQRVFVVGNAVVDEVYSTTSLPQPGESIHGSSVHVGLGGKGANQAVAVARTGVATTLIAAIGEDWGGQIIRKALASEPIEQRLIPHTECLSDRSIVVVNGRGDNMAITSNDRASALNHVACIQTLREASPGDAVFLQGNLTLECTESVLDYCYSANIKVYFNPSPYCDGFGELLSKVTALFLNEAEARSLTGLSGETAAAELVKFGPQQVVLTMGAAGAILASKEFVRHIPGKNAKVLDTTGAGDCLQGVTVGSSILRRTEIDEVAVYQGIVAATSSVSKHGAIQSFPSTRSIVTIISQQPRRE